jgi:hypothetical protein
MTSLLALPALALAACAGSDTTAPAPSGGSAGALGEAYCESPPADPAEEAAWSERCMPNDDRR